MDGSVENGIEAKDIVFESCLRARELADVDLMGVMCRPCARSLDREVGVEGLRSVCDSEVRKAAEYAISSCDWMCIEEDPGGEAGGELGAAISEA